MKLKRFLPAMAWLLPIALAAQTAPVIPMDMEVHHHLVLKNDIVKVYVADLPSHDAFPMHHHDHDDIVIATREATTVSTSPGQADILTISKIGNVSFLRSGTVHSVRNIGRDVYSITTVDLLLRQTGARNLCGRQIPNSQANCSPTVMGANASRADLPQFETDQAKITLTRIRPRQQASFGEADRDELIVTTDRAEISAVAGNGPDQTLIIGEPVWIGRGGPGRIVRNVSDKDLSIVMIVFRP